MDEDDDIGTVRWFGESWGAPICDPRAHVPTPVGEPCEHHHGTGSTIKEDDQGVTIPQYHSNGVVEAVAYHLDCFLHDIGLKTGEEVTHHEQEHA